MNQKSKSSKKSPKSIKLMLNNIFNTNKQRKSAFDKISKSVSRGTSKKTENTKLNNIIT